MFGNFQVVLLYLTILVAGTTVGLPQGGWFSGFLGKTQPAADTTKAVTTTTEATVVKHDVGVLVSDVKKNAGVVASQLGEMKGEGMKILSETKQKVHGIVTGLKSIVSGDSVKQITGSIQNTREKLKKVARDVQSLYQSRAGKPISEQLNIISDNINKILGQLGSAIGGDAGGKVMADIGQHFGKAVDEINAIIGGESVKKIINTINNVSEQLSNAVGKIGAAVTLGRGKPMGEYIGEIGKSTMNAMNQVATLVGSEGGKQLVGDISRQVENAVAQVNSIAHNDSIGKLTSMASKIGGEVGQTTSEVKNFVNNANVKDALDILRTNDKAVQLLQNYGSGLIGKFFG